MLSLLLPSHSNSVVALSSLLNAISTVLCNKCMLISDSSSIALFKGAMKMIEDAVMVDGKKCIQFVPRSQESDYVHLEMFKE